MSTVRRPIHVRIAVRLPARIPLRAGARNLPRYYSTASPAPPNSLSPRIPISAVFTVLTIFGVAATSYGLYEFYSMFTLWPKDGGLRDDLRAGIKAQHSQNYNLAERFLRRAYDTALTLPPDAFGPSPWLKISGIACKLGQVLEQAEELQKAYDVYQQCFESLQVANNLTIPERRRAIALATHLAHLTEVLQKPEAEEESYRAWGVDQFVKIYKDVTGGGDDALLKLDAPVPLTNTTGAQSDSESKAEEDLGLPKWLTQSEAEEFENALEGLGTFYARRGNVQYALSLYLRAISLILPPASPQLRAAASPERRCHAAQIMSSISSLVLSSPPSSPTSTSPDASPSDTAAPLPLAQAQSWASKSLEISTKALTDLEADVKKREGWFGFLSRRKKEEKAAQEGEVDELGECAKVWAVGMFNLGIILEMQNDFKAAQSHFASALAKSKEIGLAEGVAEAEDALARVRMRIMRGVVLPPPSNGKGKDNGKGKGNNGGRNNGNGTGEKECRETEVVAIGAAEAK
ncbi:hypothetical protein M422DRAFT_260573 [Sphaerobolus stellatus SS14]|uniref:Uncharacterized protein n=1 Tax=Sphaerobolus stellatus (strain SS14) TaxID=990650 RepID=A0A0C9UQI7_SPHS4|nr:hypothetical protein M422DRAFT_260573 [Sphaerobolus stellatus SS14]